MPHTCNRQLNSINRPTSRTTAEIVSGASKQVWAGLVVLTDSLQVEMGQHARALAAVIIIIIIIIIV